ncbi:MAG: DUF1365 domain-containing protein [Pseudomonadota bacterium]
MNAVPDIKPIAATAEPFFRPPDEAALLYPGTVMHARLKPMGHRFKYRVFTVLLDLDRLDEANRASSIFSVNRRNWLSFFESDHLPKGDDGTRSLRAYATQLVSDAGGQRPHRIVLVAYPRVFGFVFNPISVYYCYSRGDALTAVIYEVRNTFGERHTYVCRVEDGELTASGLRQERSKIFYVSPFIDMPMRYHFRMLPPGAEVKMRIFETDEAGDPLLSATFSGKAETFNTPNIAKNLLRLPFMTLKVVMGIHWEALKLWLKGAKFHSRGKPPVPVSYEDFGPKAAE